MPPFTNRFLPAFGRFFPGGGSAASSTGDPEVSKGMDEGFQAWMAQQREQANQANQYFELPSGAIPPELAAFGTPTNQGTHRFHKGAFPSIEKMAETMRQEREAKTSDTSFADYLEQSMLGGKPPITETKLGMPSPERAETEPAVPSTTERPASFSDLPPHIKALLGAMRSGKATPFQREIVKAELEKIRNPKREIQFPPKGATGYLQFNEENPEGKWVPLPASRGGLSVDVLTAKGYTPKYDAQGNIEGWVPPSAPGAGVNPESYLPRGKTRQTATPEEWKQALKQYEEGQGRIAGAKEGGKTREQIEGAIPPKEWTNIGFGKDAPSELQGKLLSEVPGLHTIGRNDLFKHYGAVDLTSVGGIKDIAETEVRTRGALAHIDLIQRAWDKARPFFPKSATDLKSLTQAQIQELYRKWYSVAPDELAALQNLKTADLNIISATVPPKGGRFGLGLLYFANSGNPADFAREPWTQTSGDAALKQWRNAVVERWQAGGGRALPGRIPEAGAISEAAHAPQPAKAGFDVDAIMRRASEIEAGRKR